MAEDSSTTHLANFVGEADDAITGANIKDLVALLVHQNMFIAMGLAEVKVRSCRWPAAPTAWTTACSRPA